MGHGPLFELLVHFEELGALARLDGVPWRWVALRPLDCIVPCQSVRITQSSVQRTGGAHGEAVPVESSDANDASDNNETVERAQRESPSKDEKDITLAVPVQTVRPRLQRNGKARTSMANQFFIKSFLGEVDGLTMV